MGESGDVVQEGYLELKLKKKWKLRWVMVMGSSLYYYKTELDDKPEGVIELAGGELNVDPKHKHNDSKNSFHVAVGDKITQFKTSSVRAS